MTSNYFKHFIISFLLLICFLSESAAATYYWVGNSGNWSDLSHWSNISGGPGSAYAQAPGSSDTVYFTDASFTMVQQVVSLDSNASVHTMDWTGSLYSPMISSLNYSDLYIYGSLKMAANTLSTVDSLIFKATTPGNQIYFGNSLYPPAFHVCFDGTGGEWTIMNSPSSINTADYYFFNGTVTFGFNSFYASKYAIEGNVMLNINAANLYIKDIMASPLSSAGFNMTSGSINISRSIDGGGKQFPELILVAPLTGPSGVFISGNLHIMSLIVSADINVKLKANDTLYVTGFLSLMSNNKIVTSDSTQTAYIHYPALINMEFNLADEQFYGIDISGATGSRFAIRSVLPFKISDYALSGFTISSRNYYWVKSAGSGSGNWETSTNRWYNNPAGTGSSFLQPPTWADSVFFTANSFVAASDTVILNAGSSAPKCASLSISGLSYTPTFHYTPGVSSLFYVCGSLFINSQINVSTTGQFTFYLMGLTPDTNTVFIGTNMNNAVSVEINPETYIFGSYTKASGPYQLTGDLNQLRDFKIHDGYFTTGGYNALLSGEFGVFGTNSHIHAILGNSLIECNSFSAEPADSGVILETESSSHIRVKDGWFIGGGHTYNSVRLELIAGGGSSSRVMTGNNTISAFETGDFSIVLNINGNNTFGSFRAGVNNTFIFLAGSTQTINGNFSNSIHIVNSVFTYCTLKSSIPGTPANIIKPSGNVFLWLPEIYDIHVSGGASFKVAPRNNFDTANNFGWIPYMTMKANGANNWKNSAHWNLGRIPSDTDRVVIAYSNIHYIDTMAVCGELWTGPNSSGSNLRFGTGPASANQLFVSGDILIQSGSVWGYDNANAGKTITVGGSIHISNGSLSLNQTGCKLIFSGSGSQSFTNTSGIAPAFIDSLLILTADTFTFNRTLQVRKYLKLASTVIHTTTDTLKLGTSASSLGTLDFQSGLIVGKFQRWFNTSTVSNVLFPLGDSVAHTHQRDVLLSYTAAPATAGTLTASFIPQHPGTTGLPLNDGGSFPVSNIAAGGYWRIQPSNGLAGGTFGIQLRGDGIPEISNVSTLRMIKRIHADSAWKFQGMHVAGTGTIASPVISRLMLNSFGDFAIAGGSDNTLPVTLLTFSGKRTSASLVQLNWSTASQLNASHFEIERSIDGRSFYKTGTVASVQQSSALLSYQFADHINNIPNSMLYYRIKSVDLNGSFAYSDIVRISDDKNNSQVSLFPNPAQDQITISHISPIRKIRITDAQGMSYFSAAPGSNELELKTDMLTNGLYFITVETEEGTEQLRLLIQH